MRTTIAKILKWQAVKFIKKNQPKVVVVSGSVGKTSTTQAIATVLEQSFRVRKTLHNYNSDLGVPCSIFAQHIPESLKNPFAWIWLILSNQVQMLRKPIFDVLVLELGTDSPGDIAKFNWLNPDIAVVTAIAPEHMEYFVTIEAVAKEELSVGEFSEMVIINKDMVDAKYLHYVQNDQMFNYSRADIKQVGLDEKDLNVIAEHSVDAVSAGLAVGRILGMKKNDLVNGAKEIKPLNGRMNSLKGIKNTTLIDDTYNASPEAVRAALEYLYSIKAPQRIALIGNMNELGKSSAEEHRKIGRLCNPKKLDLVVTLGPDANNYTATVAKEKGCFVLESETPYEAAEIIKDHLEENAVVLLKGSQNGVFAEETVKLLLDNQEDVDKLVRQSPFWLKKKVFDE